MHTVHHTNKVKEQYDQNSKSFAKLKVAIKAYEAVVSEIKNLAAEIAATKQKYKQIITQAQEVNLKANEVQRKAERLFKNYVDLDDKHSKVFNSYEEARKAFISEETRLSSLELAKNNLGPAVKRAEQILKRNNEIFTKIAASQLSALEHIDAAPVAAPGGGAAGGAAAAATAVAPIALKDEQRASKEKAIPEQSKKRKIEEDVSIVV